MSENSTPGPLLSVIIPFYDVEAYIEACLRSVCDQVLDDIEVILVDDGSRDGSRAVAERFLEEDHRLRLITQENAGLGPARNTGARLARGRYLTFVDSDDVVAPFGFARLTESLERTGSDFAAGNACRFTTERGSYPSWTHAEPFATDAERVTLSRRPDLVGDRMIWNKVFRRSFWQAHDLEFPAIRYEDYPVTIAAYLDATSVDVVSEPVYYWRDRESGTSITQQIGDAANARDRYLSACMVLDALDEHPKAPPSARSLVHTYLVRVDLVTLTTALASSDEAARVELEPLVEALARRLRPALDAPQTQIAGLIHEAWVNDRPRLAEAAARWRAGGSATSFAQEVFAQRSPTALRSVARRVVLSRTPDDLRGVRRLKSQVVALRTNGELLDVEASVTLRRAFARRATATAALVSADGREVPLPLGGWHLRDGAVRASVRIDTGAEPPCDGRLQLSIALPRGAMRWQGPLLCATDLLPPPIVGADGRVTVVTAEPALEVVTVSRPSVALARVSIDSDTFTVAADADRVVLVRPTGLPDVELTRQQPGHFTLDADAWDADAWDDPVARTATRCLRAEREGLHVPLYLQGEAAECVRSGQRQKLTRGADGTVRFIASAVDV